MMRVLIVFLIVVVSSPLVALTMYAWPDSMGIVTVLLSMLVLILIIRKQLE